jgi:hypothetical protein
VPQARARLIGADDPHRSPGRPDVHQDR